MSTPTPSEIVLNDTSNDSSNESSSLPYGLNLFIVLSSVLLSIIGFILFIIYILYKKDYIFKNGLSKISRNILIILIIIINLISLIMSIIGIIKKHTLMPNPLIYLFFIGVSGIALIISLIYWKYK